MSIPNAPYIVVVGIDFSPAAEMVLEHALEAADQHAGAQVHVLTVAAGSENALFLDGRGTDQGFSASAAAQTLRQFTEQRLKKLQCPPGNVEHVVTHLGIGDPATEITQLATELEADLVVVGTHGRRGIRRLMLGSVAEHVLRMAHAPVLVVHPKDYSTDSSVPKIAAPCPRCVEVRKQSSERELWCEQHAHVHGRRHTYHFSRPSGAHNSGFLVTRFGQ